MADRSKVKLLSKWWPFGGGGRTSSVPSSSMIGGIGVHWPRGEEHCPGDWQRNREVPADLCLSYYAVYAAITLISSDISKLRPSVVKRNSDGIQMKDPNNPVQALLNRPNNYQNRIQFFEAWSNSKLAAGNTYVLKQRDNAGKVIGLYILDPFRTKPMVSPSGVIFYELTPDPLSGLTEKVIVPAREIIHDRANCMFHPLVGMSPLYVACISASLGQSIQDNADSFFRNGSTPGGILTAPGAIDDTTASTMKQRWQEKFGGRNNGSVAVLGDGLSFEQLRMTAVDSQMIEQLKWTAENVAAVFHVPGYKIGVGTQPTYNNVEVLNQIYYQDGLQAPVEAMELSLTEGLSDDLGEGREVEFGLMSLLRMDTATRYKTWKEGISAGFIEPNWARAQENMPPVEGGDTPYLQQQNWSLSALSRRDDSELTPGTPATPPPDPDSQLASELQHIKTMLFALAGSAKNEDDAMDVKQAIEDHLCVLEASGA